MPSSIVPQDQDGQDGFNAVSSICVVLIEL